MLVWNVDTCSVVNSLTHYNPIVALSWSPSEPNYIALVRGSTNSPLICFLALIFFFFPSWNQLSGDGKCCLWDATSSPALAKALVPSPRSAEKPETCSSTSETLVDGIEWDEDSYANSQPAFQPNSGDVSQSWHWLGWLCSFAFHSNSHTDATIVAWTHEGLAYVLEWQEPEIMVEFYNRGEFGSFKFPNTLNFTMAVPWSNTTPLGCYSLNDQLPFPRSRQLAVVLLCSARSGTQLSLFPSQVCFTAHVTN